MPDVNLLLLCWREDISSCNFVFLISGNSQRSGFHLLNNYVECKKYIEIDTDRSLVVVATELILLHEKLVDQNAQSLVFHF